MTSAILMYEKDRPMLDCFSDEWRKCRNEAKQPMFISRLALAALSSPPVPSFDVSCAALKNKMQQAVDQLSSLFNKRPCMKKSELDSFFKEQMDSLFQLEMPLANQECWIRQTQKIFNAFNNDQKQEIKEMFQTYILSSEEEKEKKLAQVKDFLQKNNLQLSELVSETQKEIQSLINQITLDFKKNDSKECDELDENLQKFSDVKKSMEFADIERVALYKKAHVAAVSQRKKVRFIIEHFREKFFGSIIPLKEKEKEKEQLYKVQLACLEESIELKKNIAYCMKIIELLEESKECWEKEIQEYKQQVDLFSQDFKEQKNKLLEHQGKIYF